LVPGIVSAPPPRALAAPAYTEVQSRTMAKIFIKIFPGN
jgi:hypothetical protein